MSIRLDSTTTYGYHENAESELMRCGFFKDDKSHLPQLKIMAGVEGEYGELFAVDIAAGNQNDDILNLPLIKRVKKFINKK